MEKNVDVAIIGAGSGGLSAYHEVKKVTDNLVVINDGPYGTTCARVGCMPSKVLIQAANDFHRRRVLASEGIHGGDQLQIDSEEVMQFVRKLRDRFVRGVMGTVDEIGERNIRGRAEFVDSNTLLVDGQKIRAKKIILATGSRPRLMAHWEPYRDQILTSDSVFEQEKLPQSIVVIGTGVIGLELGQALHRLGVKTTIIGRSRKIAGLTDPEINEYVIGKFGEELDLRFEENAHVALKSDGRFEVTNIKTPFETDAVLAAFGRIPNVDQIGLEKLGVSLSSDGIPEFNRNTMQVGDLPVYIAGDVNQELALLHEASDEGRIAGYNAVRDTNTAFQRRTPLGIAFADPNLACVGQGHSSLKPGSFETGEVTFEGQGRSIVMSKEKGLLHVYGEKGTGRILGAEMMAPSGEHLAHLLAWAIQDDLTVFDVLSRPFYHPVIEEGLRTALRDLARKIDPKRQGLEIPFLDK